MEVPTPSPRPWLRPTQEGYHWYRTKRAVYGVDPPRKRVTLGRKPFTIPGGAVPTRAGRTVGRSLTATEVPPLLDGAD